MEKSIIVEKKKNPLSALDTLSPGELQRIVIANITRENDDYTKTQHLSVLAKLIEDKDAVQLESTRRRLKNILDRLTKGPRRHYGFGLHQGTPPRRKTTHRLMLQQFKLNMTGAATRNANGQKGHPTKRQTPGRMEMFT